LTCVASLLIGACSTAPALRPAPQVDLQEEVGFTITESARISADVRLDYAEAQRFLSAGDLQAGIRILEAIVTAAPDLSAPRIDLGIAYHRLGDLEAAERHLLLAVQANPNHPTAHNELGIIYRKTGRFAAARDSYLAALAVFPGYHYARRNLGILCELYLGDLDCALENYQAYMTAVANDDETSMWISDLRYRAGGGKE
jgi:Flp pilus assembly protein TadD